MNAKDKEFLVLIVRKTAEANMEPVFTQEQFNKLVRGFYEYGTEDSTLKKMRALVMEGLFCQHRIGFTLTEAAKTVGKRGF